MLLVLRLAVLGSFLVPGQITFAQAETPVLAKDADADRLIDSFFASVRAGKSAPAVDSLFADSQLMAGKIAEKQSLVAQIDNVTNIYGPILKTELVESNALGTMFLKRFYVAQHQKMLTRWEFVLVKTPTGWSAGYFGFEDQVRGWK